MTKRLRRFWLQAKSMNLDRPLFCLVLLWRAPAAIGCCCCCCCCRPVLQTIRATVLLADCCRMVNMLGLPCLNPTLKAGMPAVRQSTGLGPIMLQPQTPNKWCASLGWQCWHAQHVCKQARVGGRLLCPCAAALRSCMGHHAKSICQINLPSQAAKSTCEVNLAWLMQVNLCGMPSCTGSSSYQLRSRHEHQLERAWACPWRALWSWRGLTGSYNPVKHTSGSSRCGQLPAQFKTFPQRMPKQCMFCGCGLTSRSQKMLQWPQAN